MRTREQALRTCPTCGTDITHTDMGMRDYSWVTTLPGNIGPTDGDFILERNGNVLLIEYKPGAAPLPLGQRLTLRAFVRVGFDVWVAWQKSPRVLEVGPILWSGDLGEVRRQTLSQHDQAVGRWFEWATDNPRRADATLKR